ncbi:two-component system, LytT family, response regulator [Catalinimonas alkaloidigena]|uniref:Two-component system, LytT family, response regulator n=1 Tax=Catalinimonas alkaloidigena TaxID=1075417 RepID=A0A1G9N9R0_9BACT|nr:response regulator [Catalinimonas alkaloidigena]SDL83252.1 two-component system, LytT family, response regulator [Catalinimonas alkaloidigena]
MRTLIVDDERLARNELRRLLQAYDQIEIVGEAVNGEDALEKIKELRPELLFLDIQMPGKNGFEVLMELKENVPEVIFTTAYDEYALKAFEFNALDYLLKPIEPQRLDAAIQRLEANEPNERPLTQGSSAEPEQKILGEFDQVFVKDGDKCWFVTLGKVRLFESIGNYVRLHFDHHKPLILRSLNALDERLDSNVFFRANRKHIINLRMIETIEPYFSGGLVVRLKGGDRIEISRRQAIRFKELLSL